MNEGKIMEEEEVVMVVEVEVEVVWSRVAFLPVVSNALCTR